MQKGSVCCSIKSTLNPIAFTPSILESLQRNKSSDSIPGLSSDVPSPAVNTYGNNIVCTVLKPIGQIWNNDG